jgi:phosphatidate cytidylyltransferase
MLKARAFSVMILVPIVLWASYLGGIPFAAVVTLFGLLAGNEFFQLMRRVGQKPFIAVGLAWIVLMMVDAYLPGLALWRPTLAFMVAAPMVWTVLRRDSEGFLLGWAVTTAGALYVGGLFSHLILLRALPQGLDWIYLVLAGTWATDSLAWFFGRTFGRHGFFTHVSPHKTWEGAIAGFVGGPFTVAIVGHLLGVPWWQGVALGLALAVGAIFGDLAESLVKRQVGVKDSSNLIPGHGGALDRIDSLIFAGVIGYYFVLWFVH